MDNVSRYYVAKQVEIRHSLESEWPALLKQTLKYPHINPFTNIFNHNTNNDHCMTLCDSSRNTINASNQSPKYLTSVENSQCTNNYSIETTDYVDTYAGSSQVLDQSDMHSMIKRIMTSYVTSTYTLGSNKKNLSPSSDYECLTALKDALHQLIYSKSADLEVILITSDFSGVFSHAEAIITKCTSQFMNELKKMDVKIRRIYDLMEKEYKQTDLYRIHRDYSHLDCKKTVFKILNLPNSPMYTINTMYIKGSHASKFYSIILKRVKLSLEDDLTLFRVNYLISNYPLLYGKLCNNKMSFDTSVYFDGDLSRNFKKTIVQGHLTPGKLKLLYSLLMELENMKTLTVYTLKVSFDSNLLSDMHEKSLFIENNRIFQSFTKNQATIRENYPWVYKYLSDLVPLTLFTLHDINPTLALTDNDLLFISNSQESEYCYFYTDSRFLALVTQLSNLIDSKTFKIKIITNNSTIAMQTDLDVFNVALVNFYGKWALNEAVEIPILKPNEYISKLWLLHIMNDKTQLKKLLFHEHPFRQVATFPYLVKNIRINQFYRFCTEYDKLNITACSYSHVDWSQMSLNNADNYYDLITQQFTKVRQDLDNFTILVLCVGGSEENAVEEWENFNATKIIFHFDSVLISPSQWDISKQLNNPLSVEHICTQLNQLDEYNISSFRHLFNLTYDRCYHIIHTSQLDAKFGITTDNNDSDELLSLKDSKIIPLVLSNDLFSKAERIKESLESSGFDVLNPVNMGWIYDCYHFGLINYNNSLEIHNSSNKYNLSYYWGWTFFHINSTFENNFNNNIRNKNIDLRRSWGIDLVPVDSFNNLSQAIYGHFTKRLNEFELSENSLEFLGGDIIYTRYLILDQSLNSNYADNYFTIKIANKQLVTLGSNHGIKICLENPIESSLVEM